MVSERAREAIDLQPATGWLAADGDFFDGFHQFSEFDGSFGFFFFAGDIFRFAVANRFAGIRVDPFCIEQKLFAVAGVQFAEQGE